MDEVGSGALSGAASGAAAGSAFGPWGTVIGGVVGGAAGAVQGKGAKKSRKAAEGAARERQAAATQNYQRTADIVNPASMTALMQHDSAIATQEKNIARQEKMISQIDPTIIEASQQALKLLKGEESTALNPLRNQRQAQRAKLLNTLRSQLGPGAETSTAGIQALSKFDAETDNILGGGQMGALNQMGVTANQFNAVRPDMGREATTLGNLASSRANVAFNQANSLSAAFNGVTANAGAQYIGQQMQGMNQSATMNSMLSSAVQLGSAYGASNGYSGWGSSTAKPTATAQMSGPVSGGSYRDWSSTA